MYIYILLLTTEIIIIDHDLPKGQHHYRGLPPCTPPKNGRGIEAERERTAGA